MTFDEYIAAFPTPTQAVLKKLRALVLKAAPGASETISYKMPTFVLNGTLLHFAAYAKHIGVYGASSKTLANELAPYTAGRGTLRFALDAPLPVSLLTKLVKVRAEENAVAQRSGKDFATQAAFEKWLAANYAKNKGLWLVFAKKGSGLTRVSYPEAVEVALRFGWIDGQAAPLDEKRWLQRFTPRGTRSKWSKINVGKVEALMAAGTMHEAGLAEVERAKADGRWAAAYAPPSEMTVHPEFKKALAANKRAKTAFEKISKSVRYSMLFRVHDAKKPETRARRIEGFIKTLSGTP